MKRPSFRFALAFIALLTVPFIYNSCQGGLLGAKGFSAKSSAQQCKVRLEKGIVTKLEPIGDRQPTVFATQKVRLKEDLDQNSAQAKATGPILVPAGSSLVVLMNNRCLQENESELANYPISKSALAAHPLIPELRRQAYSWILDRAYTDEEVETISAAEPCIVGISWNRTYEHQAMALNDPGLFYQSHLGAIHAQESYDYFYNSGGGMEKTGSPVILAVLDTGVDWQHPDLQNNMWAHTNGMGIDITTLGTSLVDYNPFDMSSIGHGTHVAGLMAAIANNNTGVIGTMPFRAKIMAIKVFKVNTDGSVKSDSVYLGNALEFATLNGAHVINMSLGQVSAGAKTDSTLAAAIEAAVAAGSVVTTVIGNADNGGNGRVIDGTTYSSIPGQFATQSGVLGVGSIDSQNGEKSYFSHYSTTFAEIAAPGAEHGSTGVYSTLPRALSSYGRLAGTSQAAPIVSAAAGLTIGIIREAYGMSPSPAEVERLILESAAKASNLAPYFKDGNKLDLTRLIAKINEDYPLTKSGGGTIDLPSLGCAK